MSEPLRVGILGVGRMGVIHARNLAHGVRGARLEAIADIQVDRARAVAEQLGVPKVTDSFEELLADESIDAVVMADPTQGRVSRLIKAVKANKHIFTEKPVGLSLEELAPLEEALSGWDRVLQVGFMRRFDRAHRRAKEMLAAGDIGRPISIHAVSRDAGLPPLEFVRLSGGLLADEGIHDLDTICWLVGEQIEWVYATGGVFVYDELHQIGDVDNATVMLKFEGGCTAVLQCSRNAEYGCDVRMEVFGTRGNLVIGQIQETPLVSFSKDGVVHDFVGDFVDRFRDAYLAELQAFVDCVRNGGSPEVGFADARLVLEVVVAANRSLQTGQMVSLP